MTSIVTIPSCAGGLASALTQPPTRINSPAPRSDSRYCARSECSHDSQYIDERTVDVIVRRLRLQLEPFGCRDYIQTVRSIGYRFSALMS